jgi:NADH:ubiquinone reductase (H+-translocating)
VRAKVVIVGGGFGGIKTALELAKHHHFHVTLISDRPDFFIYGVLYRTATGGTRRIASIPLSEVFEGKNVEVLVDAAKSLDRKARTITTTSGKQVPYDALVLALGVQTNYFGIEGLPEYSFGIKTADDAEELKAHLHQQLMEEKHLDLNYVVVGGGPTGVELAGALPSYIRKIAKAHGVKHGKIHVDLVEAAPRLVPRMPKDISKAITKHLRKIGVQVRLKQTVQAQTAEALMVNDKPIRSHTVIWTAGVTNNPFFQDQGFQLAANHKVRVDQFLQAEPGIYVIGDNADTPYSGMAQVAITDAKYVARTLDRVAIGKQPKPYQPAKPIYVMPAGPKWAATLWGPFRIYGILGWWLRRAADFIAYHDYEPWQMALSRWSAEDDEEENCPTCDGDLRRVKYESGEI